jgi:hypothetical protein
MTMILTYTITMTTSFDKERMAPKNEKLSWMKDEKTSTESRLGEWHSYIRETETEADDRKGHQ